MKYTGKHLSFRTLRRKRCSLCNTAGMNIWTENNLKNAYNRTNLSQFDESQYAYFCEKWDFQSYTCMCITLKLLLFIKTDMLASARLARNVNTSCWTWQVFFFHGKGLALYKKITSLIQRPFYWLSESLTNVKFPSNLHTQPHWCYYFYIITVPLLFHNASCSN